MAMNRRYWLVAASGKNGAHNGSSIGRRGSSPGKGPLSGTADVHFQGRERAKMTHPGHEPALDALTGFYLE